MSELEYGPRVGDNVHFVASTREDYCVAAKVTRRGNPVAQSCELIVFHVGQVTYESSVFYDEDRNGRSWHYPDHDPD